MVRAVTQALDDSYVGWTLQDFAGGRNTEKNIQNLAPNESPDQQNGKLTRPDRYTGRDGWTIQCGLPAIGDGIYFIFDKNGTRHIIEWAGGNMYDTTSGSAILVATSVYTPGRVIAHTDLNNKIYWSDGVVTLQQYDPSTNTNTTVITSGATGSINPPAFQVAYAINGALVVGATTVSATFEPDNIRWCNFEDPTTWLGSSLYAVYAGKGGKVNAICQLPFNAFFVGKSQGAVFSFSGPLTATGLTPNQIPVATGVLDGKTAKYVPNGVNSSAGVVFLGTDRRVWFTNGLQCVELSVPIRSELNTYILQQLNANASAQFNAVVHYADAQYVLDVGGSTHYCLDYNQQNWTLYKGWPSGYWTDLAVDKYGFPAIYCALSNLPAVAQAANGSTDNGALINYYWKTGYIGAGDNYRYKFWHWLFVTYATDSGHIEISAQQGTNNTLIGGPVAAAILASGGTGNVSIWDQSVWDGPNVWAFTPGSLYQVYRRRHRLMTQSVNYPGKYQALRGSDIQITFQQSTVSGHFELLGAKAHILKKGFKRVG